MGPKLVKHRSGPSGACPSTLRVFEVNLRFQQEQLVQSHSLPHPTMANRQGYDVVVDVDAEVCSQSNLLTISRKEHSTNTETGRSWPYRPPRRQPRVPQLQYALLDLTPPHEDHNILTLSSLQHSPTPPPAPPKPNPTRAPSSAPQAPANNPPPSASSGASPSTSNSSTSTPRRSCRAAAPRCTRARTSSTSSRATRTSTGRSGSRPPSSSSYS